MQARRNSLLSVAKHSHTHAGLWLDKFLMAQTEEKRDKTPTFTSQEERRRAEEEAVAKGAKAQLLREVSSLSIPVGYPQALSRRQRLLFELKASKRAEVCTPTTQGRMIIGLGQKGPVEAGLSLEHTWGVPIIPGSALKGLTAAAAHQLLEHESWRKTQGDKKERGESLAQLAGTIECRGEVIFHDAWWIPGASDIKLPIHPDVMTVHHAEYYADGTTPPSDMDSPNPVAFASVKGQFLIAVERSSPTVSADVLDAAMYILKVGLHRLGIGAKTNAGYGRMELDYESPAERKRNEADEAAAQAERLRTEQLAAQRKDEQQRELALRNVQGQLKNINDGNAPQQVPAILKLFANDSERVRIARQIVEKLELKKVRKKAAEQKPWAEELLRAAQLGD